MVSLPILELVIQAVVTVMTVAGLVGLVALMFFESFGIPPLPSEIILPFAGFLVVDGTFSFWGALAAALVGGLLGSYAGYAVGRYGRSWLERPNARWLKLDPKHLTSIDEWFQRRGEVTVAVARLVPIIRSYVSYPAGTARMAPVKFGVYTLLGATPFTVALIYAGMVLRSHWDALVPYFNLADYVAVAALAIFGILLALRWTGRLPRRSKEASTPSTGSPPPAAGGPP